MILDQELRFIDGHWLRLTGGTQNHFHRLISLVRIGDLHDVARHLSRHLLGIDGHLQIDRAPRHMVPPQHLNRGDMQPLGDLPQCVFTPSIIAS